MDSPLGALGSLADTIVIKDGNVFLVAMRDGRLPAEVEHPLGLWFRDCRFLCVHELRIGGRLPRLLTATDAAGTQAVHELTNPDLDLGGGERLPGESLRLRLERTAEAAGALRQGIAVRSYHPQPIRVPVELRLGADFQPMLELRGIVPKHERPAPDESPEGFFLVGRDGVPDEAFTLEVVDAMKQRRVLLATAGVANTTLKIRPPLPFDDADTDRLLETLGAVLAG